MSSLTSPNPLRHVQSFVCSRGLVALGIGCRAHEVGKGRGRRGKLWLSVSLGHAHFRCLCRVRA